MPRKSNFADIAKMSGICQRLMLALLLPCAVALFSDKAYAQRNRYVVHFADKSGSPFTISNPKAFLSDRAIARRVRNQVLVTTEDLPVNPAYIQNLRSAGCNVLYSSRWFNCTLVEADDLQIASVGQFSMVSRVEPVAPLTVSATGRTSTKKTAPSAGRSTNYSTQLLMLGIDQMHADGWTGEGIRIAVMDSGFPDVNTAVGFQELNGSNRILDSYNFAWQRKDVFGYDSHGSEVLSILAGRLGEKYTGVLPDAEYLLYVTEYVPSEYRIEEYNWLFAAERADSAGADLINTSLGYSTFDDNSMDYTYNDMDGLTTVISKAATYAAARGIVVVASAGNSGGSSWPYIGAPADAAGVCAVGSVNSSKIHSPFSSRGPTADGRVKPDVSAMGSSTELLSGGSVISNGSGTSLSAPLICGLAGGILQSRPQATAAEIQDLLRSAGSMADRPDNLLGYGIPDYNSIRVVTAISRKDQVGLIRIFPNPVNGGSVTIQTNEPQTEIISAHLISADGRTMKLELKAGDSPSNWTASLALVSPGIHILQCITSRSGQVLCTRVVVH